MQDIFYETDNQLSTLWDLEVLNSDKTPLLKTRIVESTIPFTQLNTERKFSGKVFFKDVTYPDEFSITLRESSNFTVYKFFKEVLDKFYDFEQNTFKTFSSKSEYEQNLLNLKFSFYKGKSIAFGIGTGIEGVEIKKDTMEESYSFFAINCLPLSISDINLSYESGDALQVTINMTAEKIIDRDEDKKWKN